jgi:hypothetical protein
MFNSNFNFSVMLRFNPTLKIFLVYSLVGVIPLASKAVLLADDPSRALAVWSKIREKIQEGG